MIARLIPAAALLAVGLVAAPVMAQTATPRPTTAQPQQAARPAAPQQAQQPLFNNLQNVCQMRERELVGLNTQLVLRNNAASRETDATKKSQLLQPMEGLRSNLLATEASWQRMDCARLLYGR